MIWKIRQKINDIIRTLYLNSEYVKIYLIPFFLFLLDIALRAVIKVDLGDVGADMAFLAFATFFSVILENFNETASKRMPAIILFILVFMLPWLFCLWSISNHHDNDVDFFRIALGILSWIVGMTSLVLSGVIVHQIVEEQQ